MTGLQSGIRASVFYAWIEESTLVPVERGVKVGHHTGNPVANSISLFYFANFDNGLNLNVTFVARNIHIGPVTHELVQRCELIVQNCIRTNLIFLHNLSLKSSLWVFAVNFVSISIGP